VDLDAMYALMRDITPLPKRELRCGRTAWDVLRSNGDPSARRSPLDAFMGIPVHIDPDLADGAWKILEDGEVVTEGDMTPGYRRSYWIVGVGLVGASDEAAAMVDANIEQARRGGE
jgi:hypothetical protein